MDFLRCVVERITYQNEENGYSVIKAKAKGFTDLVAIVGSMASVSVGCVLSVRGEWKVDSKYGKQFVASSWEETLPATVYGIEKYLGSGLIKGIGPMYAKKIVEKFGTETLNVIENSPDDLVSVDKIGKKRVETIKKAWEEQKEIKNLMLFLTGHGVSTGHAVKIYKAYGSNSIGTVRENPYRLADDIWGIGFQTADRIAEKLGFDKACYVRCRGGILHTLNQLSNDGHCYAAREQLTEAAAELLDIEGYKISMTMDHIIKEGDVIKDDQDAIYIPPLYYSEIGVTNRLAAIQAASAPKTPSGLVSQIDSLMAKAQKLHPQGVGIKYSDIQKEAIKQSLLSKALVITGGPGTGKTTTILGIISLLKQLGLDILLAAPTGRAAKRMTETCGFEAKTVHRLLGYKPPNGYEHDANNPLEGDALIVDEFSMMDVVLTNSLLKAVPDEMKIIFVGDVDQLPSVGPGNVLSDIIASGAVPVIRLNAIFRQAQGSDIIKNAHLINKGTFPSLSNGKSTDFFFIEQEDSSLIPQAIAELCKVRLPKYYGIDPVQDIQVLCPMNRSENGSSNLNAVLQAALNPSAECVKRGGTEFRLGDKVMQIKNNYDKNIFNGDMGVISSIDAEDGGICVCFDGCEVSYEASELDELVLSYAVSIHKSQGSEYPVVIMPFTMQFFKMLQRNLLYTGITRAKKVLIMIGSKKAIGCAVKNANTSKRNTGLAGRLAGVVCGQVG